MLHSCPGEPTANPPHSRMRERERQGGRRQEEGGEDRGWEERGENKGYKIDGMIWKRERERKDKTEKDGVKTTNRELAGR